MEKSGFCCNFGEVKKLFQTTLATKLHNQQSSDRLELLLYIQARHQICRLKELPVLSSFGCWSDKMGEIHSTRRVVIFGNLRCIATSHSLIEILLYYHHCMSSSFMCHISHPCSFSETHLWLNIHEDFEVFTEKITLLIRSLNVSCTKNVYLSDWVNLMNRKIEFKVGRLSTHVPIDHVCACKMWMNNLNIE